MTLIRDTGLPVPESWDEYSEYEPIEVREDNIVEVLEHIQEHLVKNKRSNFHNRRIVQGLNRLAAEFGSLFSMEQQETR